MRGENKYVFSFCLPAAQSPFSLPRPSFFPSCFPSVIPLSVTRRVPVHPSLRSSISPISSHCPSSNCCRLSRDACLSILILSPQKRKTTTISVEVKKSQHKYIIGPKGNTLQEILEATGVSVEMPPLDSSSETIILRGEPDKLGPALTQVYAKVRRRGRRRGKE